MRLGRSSWRVSFGEPERLVVALYVRDATGLQVTTDPLIPPLEPIVAVHESLPAGVDRIAASTQWGEWWAGLLLLGGEVGRVRLPEPRTELRELTDRPALQALAREVFPEASVWAGQRKRETAKMTHSPEEGAVRTERRLIQEVTRRHRWRRLHPFHLQITQLPVAGVQGWRVSEDHVVVTRGLRRDVDAYREWLSPVGGRTRPRCCARPLTPIALRSRAATTATDGSRSVVPHGPTPQGQELARQKSAGHHALHPDLGIVDEHGRNLLRHHHPPSHPTRHLHQRQKTSSPPSKTSSTAGTTAAPRSSGPKPPTTSSPKRTVKQLQTRDTSSCGTGAARAWRRTLAGSRSSSWTCRCCVPRSGWALRRCARPVWSPGSSSRPGTSSRCCVSRTG